MPNKDIKDKNRHIKDYIKDYSSLPYTPHYAVLVRGAWGIGKTFLIKSLLKKQFDESKEFIYVSLFGLNSIDEIDAALFRAMYPALGWKGTRLGAHVGKVALKWFGLESDIKLEEVLNKFSNRLLIFDDLERCELPTNTILGYINEFVEHDDCKVIIVANEDEIKDKDEYSKRREKLIGKTLEVQSALDEALSYFCSLIKSKPAKSFLRAHRSEVATIYDHSGLKNLRILQQTIWDFERLFGALSAKQRQEPRALDVMLGLFFALSFEIKAGRIQESDLRSRLDKIVGGSIARKENREPTPLASANSRYPEVQLSDSILSDEILADLLIKGIVDKKRIQACLDQSGHFAAKRPEPSWRVVWHAIERTDQEFEQSYNEMERQFIAREFELSGVILHVFGLRLWLADIGISGKTRSEVVSEGKAYIEDMYAKRRLKQLNTDPEIEEMHFGGYSGLGVYENKTEEFQELYKYLMDKREKLTRETYPSKALKLIEEMIIDPEVFFRRVTANNSPESIYYRVPILASIDAHVFVSTLLTLHPLAQRTVLTALSSRYEHGHLVRELGEEREWLVSVRQKLAAAADGLPAIAKYRLNKLVEWTINPVIDLAVDQANQGGAT